MKIEQLTPQQEANIVPHRDYWLNYILSCKNKIDKEKAQKVSNGCTSFVKKKNL